MTNPHAAPLSSGRDSTKLHRAELIISHFLRIGVLGSAGILFLGLAWSWISPHPTGFSEQDLQLLVTGQKLANTGISTSVSGLIQSLAFLDPSAIIEVGLILLIGLPIGRVALTVIVFFLERDFLYFVITCVVLSVLILGILFGKVI